MQFKELCANAALTIVGHVRPRPDPAFEAMLRAAFADLDRELALVLGDRTVGTSDAWHR